MISARLSTASYFNPRAEEKKKRKKKNARAEGLVMKAGLQVKSIANVSVSPYPESSIISCCATRKNFLYSDFGLRLGAFSSRNTYT